VNVEIKEAGEARKIVNVSFDSDEMSSKDKEVCRELGRLANIPGFRKGKAPEQVIRKKYAKEIHQELTAKFLLQPTKPFSKIKKLKFIPSSKLNQVNFRKANPQQLKLPLTSSQILNFRNMKSMNLLFIQAKLKMRILIRSLKPLGIKGLHLTKSNVPPRKVTT